MHALGLHAPYGYLQCTDTMEWEAAPPGQYHLWVQAKNPKLLPLAEATLVLVMDGTEHVAAVTHLGANGAKLVYEIECSVTTNYAQFTVG